MTSSETPDPYQHRAALGALIRTAAALGSTHDEGNIPDTKRVNDIQTCEQFMTLLVDSGAMIVRIPDAHRLMDAVSLVSVLALHQWDEFAHCRECDIPMPSREALASHQIEKMTEAGFSVVTGMLLPLTSQSGDLCACGHRYGRHTTDLDQCLECLTNEPIHLRCHTYRLDPNQVAKR